MCPLVCFPLFTFLTSFWCFSLSSLSWSHFSSSFCHIYLPVEYSCKHRFITVHWWVISGWVMMQIGWWDLRVVFVWWCHKWTYLWHWWLLQLLVESVMPDWRICGMNWWWWWVLLFALLGTWL